MVNEIDKALGVVGEVIPPESSLNPKSKMSVVSRYPEDRPAEDEDIDADYKYQRENFYRLVEQGSAAIEGILELAREGEHPRAYEVAGQLIKNVAEVTEKLGDLQEKMKKLKEVPDHGPKSVTNALFVGSTAELQKMLKSKSE
jgi:hypothetical protein|tara:strand:- start:1195 stop:1623 length:429 start_codon:yes stop_codon:yes gene_type:complete